MIDRSAEILANFPPVEFAFTYGSGAVEQGGYSYERKASDLPMIDFIFVVKDSEEWHRNNMERNPSHYSPLLPMNSKMVAFVQEKIPAHCWFNAYVPITSGPQAGRMMKYGVISQKQVLQDLTSWNTLYIAGRLHKPVNIIRSNADIESAMVGNRNQALRTALLMLPDTFSETELYMAIASLSYNGDPRMFLGENPKKIRNLVTPIVPQYRALYRPSFDLLHKESDVTMVNDSGKFHQDKEPSVRWKMCLQLPSTLKTMLSIKNREQFAHCKPPLPTTIRAALSSIVGPSAGIQSIKGLFTVGLFKSSTYLAAKVAKRFLAV